MAKFIDALRGYAAEVLRRENYVCVYCGLDGKVWPHWLYFSWDHLLPRGHAKRDDPEYIVAACTFCNTLANRTVFEIEGKTREQLVAQKRPVILARREDYRRYWEAEVRPTIPNSVANPAQSSPSVGG